MEDRQQENRVTTDGIPVYRQSSGESKKSKKKRNFWKRKNSKTLNETQQTEDDAESIGEIRPEVTPDNFDSEDDEKDGEVKQDDESVSKVDDSNLQEEENTTRNEEDNLNVIEYNKMHPEDICSSSYDHRVVCNLSKHSPHSVKKDENNVLNSLILTEDVKEVEDLAVDGQMFTAPEVQLPEPIAPAIKEIDEIEDQVQLAEEDSNNLNFLLKESKTYEVENYSKNSMIIFNHFDIKGYERKRYGTEKDVAALTETFSKLGFKDDILVHDDLDYRGIYKTLEEYSSSDFTQHGCVMVVVLTHGSEGGYIRANDREYHESELIGHFFDKHNTTLIAKPIVFLIQACRGIKASKAVTVGLLADVQHDAAKETRVYTLPTESDVLLLHSSFAGMAAHRDIINGSWFIQTFCQYVNRYADTMDLEAIMTEVKNDVAINKQHLVFNRATGRTDINKQIPVVMSTLIRKLYFKKPPTISITPEIQFQNISSIDNSSESKIDSPSIDYRRSVSPKQNLLHMRSALQIFHEVDPASTSRILLNIANSIDENVVPDAIMDSTAREISEYLKKHAGHWNLYNMIMFL